MQHFDSHHEHKIEKKLRKSAENGHFEMEYTVKLPRGYKRLITEHDRTSFVETFFDKIEAHIDNTLNSKVDNAIRTPNNLEYTVTRKYKSEVTNSKMIFRFVWFPETKDFRQ